MLQLYIGNKNYSSWSLRSWLLLKVAGIEFEEVRLRLDVEPGSAFKEAIAAVTPAGKVPVLVDAGFAVWDTLAIAEYVAERFPDRGVWPADRLARARARSVCAEMHAGFAALRQHCPMNIEADLGAEGARVIRDLPDVAADLDRITAMWSDVLLRHGGAHLFGGFSAADACFAPVCSRIRTYALPVPAVVDAYVDRILALPDMQAWTADAVAEHDFLPFDEPYRQRV